MTTKSFTNDPNFKPYKIGQLLDFHQRPCKLEPDQKYQLVTVKRRNEGIVSRGIFKGSDIKTPSQFYIKDGDFLISKRQIVHGACEIVPSKFDGAIVSNEYTIATGKEDKVLTKYFNLLSKTNVMKNHYFLSSYGVDIEKMVFNLEDWKKRLINIPSIEEQKKVVTFFQIITQKIQLQQEKIDLLKEQKKGYMQKIFSQKIRFKDGNNKFYPEWSTKKIKDVFTVTRGKVLATNAISNITGNYPVYSSQTKNNGLLGYYDDYLFENAITWTTDGANAGDTKYRNGKFYCTNVCGVLINEEGYANTFMAELINSVSHKYVSYVGNPKLMNNVMGEIELKFPVVEEQLKIANFIDILNNKILLEEQKIESFYRQKQAFMQQMFI